MRFEREADTLHSLAKESLIFFQIDQRNILFFDCSHSVCSLAGVIVGGGGEEECVVVIGGGGEVVEM